jgi:hypothetical protein
MPLAGHLSEIGERILKVGSKNASYITTMDWGLGALTKSSDKLILPS